MPPSMTNSAGLPTLVLVHGAWQGRARQIRHIDSAHSPFLSRPLELAGILAEVASAAR
jgi:hypothetical protein